MTEQVKDREGEQHLMHQWILILFLSTFFFPQTLDFVTLAMLNIIKSYGNTADIFRYLLVKGIHSFRLFAFLSSFLAALAAWLC